LRPTHEDQVFFLNRSGKAKQMRTRLVSKLGQAIFQEIFNFLSEQKQRRLDDDKVS